MKLWLAWNHRNRVTIFCLVLSGLACLVSCRASPNLPGSTYPEKRSSSAIAVTPDGALLLVVNPDSNTVSLLETGTLTIRSEISVGRDPRTVSIDGIGKRAVVANRASGSISVIDLEKQQVSGEIPVGTLPWGVVISRDGSTAYVACEEDHRLVVVDLKYHLVRDEIRVEDRPNGVALSRDGQKLYVTHLLSGRLTVIDLHGMRVQDVISTWPDGNLSQSVVLNPGGERAYLPLTRSNSANRRLSFDTTVFPLIAVIDLASGEMLPREGISLPEADQPVGLPYDAAFLPDGSKLYVVNAASDDLSVIDPQSGFAAAHLSLGRNPRGVVASPDGERIYVNNTLSGTVSVVDTRWDRVITEIPVTDIPLPPALLRGKRLFHSSRHPDLSRDGWISCNTCHWEGEQDGKTWFFQFAGPRNTTSLAGMIHTYPLRWSAEWDESADSEFAITMEQFGEGLIDGEMHPTLAEANSGRSYDLDCLALFIDSLPFLSFPERNANEQDAVQRGEDLFYNARTGCADCHPPPYYTDFRVHDVGTGQGAHEILGPSFDTPALLNLTRSNPYLHDGRASTLLEIFTLYNQDDQHGTTSHLKLDELESLVAFMRSLTGQPE